MAKSVLFSTICIHSKYIQYHGVINWGENFHENVLLTHIMKNHCNFNEIQKLSI